MDVSDILSPLNDAQREAVAADFINCEKIAGTETPADIVSKEYWGMQSAWPVLKPLLYWMGDTADCKTKADHDTQLKVTQQE